MKRWKLAVALLAVCLSSSAVCLAAGPRPDMVTADTERAIRVGLAALASKQFPSGSWAGSGGGYEAAMTGLAGVAMLASGQSPTRGEYARNVRKAIYWVLSQQDPATGLICSQGEESRSMYGHGFCMLFLGEALGMTGSRELDVRIKKALQLGVKLIEGSQSDLGGWIYTPGSKSDEGSVTVTQVQALRSCENAGVQVNKAIVEKAFEYLLKAKCADGGIAYSVQTAGSGSRPAITAAALTCLFSAGKHDTPLAKSTLDYCVKNYKGTMGSGGVGGHFYYTHLYLAEALYQHGGATWNDYYPKIRDVLLKLQSNGVWREDSVGDVYGTAIALIVLQLPYGYLPIVQR